MLVLATDIAGPTSSDLLRTVGAPALAEGACVALLGALPGLQAFSKGDGGIEVPPDVPRTLGAESDWIWTGLGGHLELEAYLRMLGK